MVRGESGRIVLEIDPSQKDNLYSVLKKNGLTLREWFLQQTDRYLRINSNLLQDKAPIVSEVLTTYDSKKKRALANHPKKM